MVPGTPPDGVQPAEEEPGPEVATVKAPEIAVVPEMLPMKSEEEPGTCPCSANALSMLCFPVPCALRFRLKTRHGAPCIGAHIV